jgi:hypothetical protein
MEHGLADVEVGSGASPGEHRYNPSLLSILDEGLRRRTVHFDLRAHLLDL